jgi:MFS family permease
MFFYWVIAFMFFLHGVSHALVTVAGFCLNCDFAPETTHNMISAVWNMTDASSGIFLTLYFRYVSKNWVWPQLFGIIVTILSGMGILLWVPESPKWLYREGRYDECCDGLEQAAKFNNKTLPSANRLR